MVVKLLCTSHPVCAGYIDRNYTFLIRFPAILMVFSVQGETKSGGSLTVSCNSLDVISNKGSRISITVWRTNFTIDNTDGFLLICSPIPPKLMLRRNALKIAITYSRFLHMVTKCDEVLFFRGFLFKTSSFMDDSLLK